jgi:hypothetical protein
MRWRTSGACTGTTGLAIGCAGDPGRLIGSIRGFVAIGGTTVADNGAAGAFASEDVAAGFASATGAGFVSATNEAFVSGFVGGTLADLLSTG